VALHHGHRGQAPWWYICLRLAATWGLPPWELERAPLVWVLRQLKVWEIETSCQRSH